MLALFLAVPCNIGCKPADLHHDLLCARLVVHVSNVSKPSIPTLDEGSRGLILLDRFRREDKRLRPRLRRWQVECVFRSNTLQEDCLLAVRSVEVDWRDGGCSTVALLALQRELRCFNVSEKISVKIDVDNVLAAPSKARISSLSIWIYRLHTEFEILEGCITD